MENCFHYKMQGETKKKVNLSRCKNWNKSKIDN